jgi:hypothetical protein
MSRLSTTLKAGIAAVALTAAAATLFTSTEVSARGFGGGMMRGMGGHAVHAMRMPANHAMLGRVAGHRSLAAHGIHRELSRHAEHTDRHTDRHADRHDDDDRHHRHHDHLIVDSVPLFGPPLLIPTGGQTVIAEGPGGGTTIEKVEQPCSGGVLRVTTAKNACINGKVYIEGDNYYYCASENKWQSRHYSVPAVPAATCDGTPPAGKVLPPDWLEPESGEACQETGRTLVQYSPEGGHWMRITWKIWKCRTAGGAEVERLGASPERFNINEDISNDPPVSNEVK